MRRTAYWSRPIFLWSISVVLPLMAIPVVLLEEAIMGLEGSVPPAAELSDVEATMLVLAWLGGPAVFAIPYLLGYRGGATMLPLFGRGWFAALLAICTLLFSAVFLLAAFVGTEFPQPHSWPMAGWLTAVAVYLQALRAAAVRRSLPDEREALAQVFE